MTGVITLVKIWAVTRAIFGACYTHLFVCFPKYATICRIHCTMRYMSVNLKDRVAQRGDTPPGN